MLNVQGSVSMDSQFALGQVTSVPKEQNLPIVFDEGENSQVTPHSAPPRWFAFTVGGPWLMSVHTACGRV